MKVRIALDAMGGDSLALPNLQGAYLALTKSVAEPADLKIYLCGPEDLVTDKLELASCDEDTKPEYRPDISKFKDFLNSGQIEHVVASEVVGMEESPAIAIRAKKDSSMAKCFHLVRDGRADAAISAGNSGAMLAYGISILKRLPDVKRPALMCHFPATNTNGVTCLLDAGANADCTPQQLEQFAVMGKVYTQSVFKTEKPKIALLNIGEEESKGNELVKETHKLLKDMPEYVGFVEGREILTGKVDVIVCDGFVGNIVLKTVEGVAKSIQGILKEQLSKNPVWGLGAWLAKGGFKSMKSKLDYREYGAAPLIGLQGLGLVAHGSSDAKAISNAIRIASLYAQQDLMPHLKESFSASEKEKEIASS